MRSPNSIVLVVLASSVLMGLTGCKDYELAWWNWFDPSRPLRAPGQATINPIFTQAGLSDQTLELLPNSEMPRPEDLEYAEVDYVIGPTDVLTINIMDLYQEGLETVVQRQVSHAGFIDLPLVENRVKASGLTQTELVEAVKQAYMPNVLKDPTVAAAVVVPRGSTFSILGAVARPGTYNILRKDFTLLEALALAGDVTQYNIEWVYIIRSKEKARAGAAATPTPPPADTPLPPLPTIPGADTQPTSAPSIEDQLKGLREAIGAPATPVALSAMSLGPAGSGPASARSTSVPEDLKAATPKTDWTYDGENWRVASGAPATKTAGGAETRPVIPAGPVDAKDPFGWGEYDMSHLKRLVAVDLKKLKDGDPRMNIIIRDNDIVHIPNLQIGEFYVMGEVARPGAYALTGRRVTVKQAIAAAGNLGALSWPNNSILIRRIGRNQEQIMPLKLQDIMSGNEPDLFLKPDDTIAVGSYWAAPFLAVWRNAFRMTYGFGFIYDRNYSVSDFEVPIFFPSKGLR